jgi:hypothetical protein
MRCQDVIRAISCPTGADDPAELNRHLASCPRCSAAAKLSQQLECLWAETHPAEPPLAFEMAWADVLRRLEASELSTERPVLLPSRRRWWLALSVPVAATAAVFVAMAVLLHPGGTASTPIANNAPSLAKPASPASDPVPLVAYHVNVDAGLPVFIHMDDHEVDVELLKRMSTDEKNLVAADFDMFNTLESLAQQ